MTINIKLNPQSIPSLSTGKNLATVKKELAAHLIKTLGLISDRAESLVNKLGIKSIAESDGVLDVLEKTEADQLISKLREVFNISETIYDPTSGELKFMINNGKACISFKVLAHNNEDGLNKLLNLMKAMGINETEASQFVKNLKATDGEKFVCSTDPKLVVEIKHLQMESRYKPFLDEKRVEEMCSRGFGDNKIGAYEYDEYLYGTQQDPISSNEFVLPSRPDYFQKPSKLSAPIDTGFSFGVSEQFDLEKINIDDILNSLDTSESYWKACELIRVLEFENIPENEKELRLLLNEEERLNPGSDRAIKMQDLLSTIDSLKSSKSASKKYENEQAQFWAMLQTERAVRDMASTYLNDDQKIEYHNAIKTGDVDKLRQLEDVAKKVLEEQSKSKDRTEIERTNAKGNLEILNRYHEFKLNQLEQVKSIDTSNQRIRDAFVNKDNEYKAEIGWTQLSEGKLSTACITVLDKIIVTTRKIGEEVTGGYAKNVENIETKIKILDEQRKVQMQKAEVAKLSNNTEMLKECEVALYYIDQQKIKLQEILLALNKDQGRYENNPDYETEKSQTNLKSAKNGMEVASDDLAQLDTAINRDIESVKSEILKIELGLASSENSITYESLNPFSDWLRESDKIEARIDSMFAKVFEKIINKDEKATILAIKNKFQIYMENLLNQKADQNQDALVHMGKQIEKLEAKWLS